MTDKLPKYVRNANKILQFISEQPDKIWDHPQKDLAEQLGFSLAELSGLLKILYETGKIRKGRRLVGHRGRTSMIHLVDATPYDSPIRRELANRMEREDRPLTPEEEVRGIVDIGALTPEQIGSALLRVLRSAWENEERYTEIRTEQMERIRNFREQLTEERTLRIRLVEESEDLKRELESKDLELTRLRGEINTLLLKVHNKEGVGSFQVRDLLDDQELAMLNSLMQSKPGHYRQSDKEIGLAS